MWSRKRGTSDVGVDLDGLRDTGDGGGNLDGLPPVADIRGRGMLIGVQLDRDCPEIRDDALAQNVIVNVTRGSTIRLLPPLIASDDEVDRIADVVAGSIRARYCP